MRGRCGGAQIKACGIHPHDLFNPVVFQPGDPCSNRRAGHKLKVFWPHTKNQPTVSLCHAGVIKGYALRNHCLATHQQSGQQIDRWCADGPCDKGIARIGVNFLRRADLHQSALVQHADAVPHRHGLDLIMGDEQECLSQIHLQTL